jgi:Bacterial archaeo-eukaryotic release factor family 10
MAPVRSRRAAKRRSDVDAAAGIVLVSADAATIAEWHPRAVEEIRKLDLDLTEAEEHELVGPSYSHPRGSAEKAAAARSSAQRDLWRRRLEAHRARFARSAAAAAARTARGRGWDLVLVLGDPRRARPACEELRRRGIAAVRSELVLDWLRPAALASKLAPEVARARAEVYKSGSSR